MKIKVAYENKKDKELLELNQSTTPYFIEYIDVTTKTGLKDSYKLKGPYGARLNPFIVFVKSFFLDLFINGFNFILFLLC